MSSYFFNLVLYLVLQISTIFCTITSKGFSTKLIHRDSLDSPLYDQSLSPKERSNLAIQRSISRLSRFKWAHNLETGHLENSTIFREDGEYLMEFYVGTPPFKQLAIADTGSDITWTQCLPCEICFKQNQPMFDSEKSSTFEKLTCGSSLCGELGYNKACDKADAACEYRLSYGDQSSSSGVLALETYTIGGTSIPKLGYGCSHSSNGTFQPYTSGIVGLGGGALSLISQLRNSISGKFSYCLVSSNTNVGKSTINFGSNGIVSGSNVVSTPLVKGEIDTYYYLTLEGISVGNSRFHYSDGTTSVGKSRFNYSDGTTSVGKSRLNYSDGTTSAGKSTFNYSDGTASVGKAGPTKKGNIIIDSGTTLTFLPFTLAENVENSMKHLIKAEPIPDPEEYFTLCYKNTQNFTAPMITAHFAGGADLNLPWTSTFYVNDDLLCLGFLTNEDMNIYGNMLQRDFLIGYDLENGKLSFKPTDCSKE